MRGYFSEGTQQCARTVMFVRVEPMMLTWLVVPLPEMPTSPPLPSACIPHDAQSSRRRPPAPIPDTLGTLGAGVRRRCDCCKAQCGHRMPPKHNGNHEFVHTQS